MNKTLLEAHISVNPAIQHGRPCVKGTRVPVHVVLEALATGMTVEDVQREFGPITSDAIHACLLYAALLANEEELVGSPS